MDQKKARKRPAARVTTKKVRSGLEKKVVQCLTERKVKFEYETKRLKYTVPEKYREYIPDFYIEDQDLYIEAKGIFDREAREKMGYIKAQHPELNIKLLFQRDNKIAKNSKTRYSDWARKNGYDFAVSENGEIPESWLTGVATDSVPESNRRPASAGGSGRKRVRKSNVRNS